MLVSSRTQDNVGGSYAYYQIGNEIHILLNEGQEIPDGAKHMGLFVCGGKAVRHKTFNVSEMEKIAQKYGGKFQPLRRERKKRRGNAPTQT